MIDELSGPMVDTMMLGKSLHCKKVITFVVGDKQLDITVWV